MSVTSNRLSDFHLASSRTGEGLQHSPQLMPGALVEAKER
jgi:hypothetical protein